MVIFNVFKFTGMKIKSKQDNVKGLSHWASTGFTKLHTAKTPLQETSRPHRMAKHLSITSAFVLLTLFAGVFSCEASPREDVPKQPATSSPWRKKITTEFPRRKIISAESPTIISYVHLDVPPDRTTGITYPIEKNGIQVANLTVLENANREVAGVLLGFWKGNWDRVQDSRSGRFRLEIERDRKYFEEEEVFRVSVLLHNRSDEVTTWGKRLGVMVHLPRKASYSLVFWEIPPYEAEDSGHGKLTQDLFCAHTRPTTSEFPITTVILGIFVAVLAVTLGCVCLSGRRGRGRGQEADVKPTSEAKAEGDYCEFVGPKLEATRAVDKDMKEVNPCMPDSTPAVGVRHQAYCNLRVQTSGPPGVPGENEHETKWYYENHWIEN
ncbi:uncharacterized protein LOC143037187 [Oratosquilla oratoria]|uniref:uncharacterized protein LOC143037187 n=1 Tax=Oratosquilla oratoria TaxID=337810 RepID=UPI003F758341